MHYLFIYFKGDGLLLQKTLEVRIIHWYENEFQNYLEVAEALIIWGYEKCKNTQKWWNYRMRWLTTVNKMNKIMNSFCECLVRPSRRGHGKRAAVTPSSRLKLLLNGSRPYSLLDCGHDTMDGSRTCTSLIDSQELGLTHLLLVFAC